MSVQTEAEPGLINEAGIAQLREFCKTDLTQTLSAVAKYRGESVEQARQFVDTLPAVVVVLPGDIRQFQVPNVNLLQIDEFLQEDERVVNNPLLRSWLPIRRGQVGMEGLGAVTADLQAYAEPYTAAFLKGLQRMREAGYAGFGDFLDKAGYTPARLNSLFDAIRSIKDTTYPNVTHAAEIRRQPWPKAEPLVSAADMRAVLAPYFPGGIPEIEYAGFDDQRASALLLGSVNPGGEAELRMCLVHGPQIQGHVEVHELAHMYYAIQMARSGLFPNAISASGQQEVFARTIGGVDPGEAAFFATCAEAANGFSRHVDFSSTQRDATRRIAQSLASGDLVQTLDRTGMKPVKSSAVVPFGAYSVPYFVDVAESLAVRKQLVSQGVNNPEAIFTAVRGRPLLKVKN